MSERLPVVIAGAGPVGMVAALKLAKAGIPVRLYEMGVFDEERALSVPRKVL